MPNARIKAGEDAEAARLRYNEEARAYRALRKAEGRPLAGKTHEQVRFHAWWKKYRLRPEQVRQLWRDQGMGCAGCGKPVAEPGTDGRGPDSSLHTHIDHCHTTGKVRGILCSGCNLAIGHAKDNPDRLRKLAEYLTRSALIG